MNLLRWVATNRYHYKGRTLIVGGLCGLLLFLFVAAVTLMQNVADQARKPLNALNTELIIQKPGNAEQSGGLKTGGLIQPFNMSPFQRQHVNTSLSQLDSVTSTSSALILWKLDTRGTLVLAGLSGKDPSVGLRAIESMLIKGSFFSSDNAEEVILERHYAAFFGHKLGSSYALQGKDLKIVGLVDFVDQSNLNTASIFLPYETATDLSETPSGTINQTFVSLASAADMEPLTRAVQEQLPGFQLITKDNLYKNLKGLNGLMANFGMWITAVIFGVSLLLIVFLLKMHVSDFRNSGKTLIMLGWPARLCRRWVLLDITVIMLTAALFCVVLSVLFISFGLPAVESPQSGLQELVL